MQTYAEEKALEVQKKRQEYLAFVAHDLRNPHTAISLAACALGSPLETGQDDEEGAFMIKTLHRNVGQFEALRAKVLEENANLIAVEGVSLERRHFHLWALVQALRQSMGQVAANT